MRKSTDLDTPIRGVQSTRKVTLSVRIFKSGLFRGWIHLVWEGSGARGLNKPVCFFCWKPQPESPTCPKSELSSDEANPLHLSSPAIYTSSKPGLTFLSHNEHCQSFYPLCSSIHLRQQFAWAERNASLLIAVHEGRDILGLGGLMTLFL